VGRVLISRRCANQELPSRDSLHSHAASHLIPMRKESVYGEMHITSVMASME
jgi:hypothetical protein